MTSYLTHRARHRIPGSLPVRRIQQLTVTYKRSVHGNTASVERTDAATRQPEQSPWLSYWVSTASVSSGLFFSCVCCSFITYIRQHLSCWNFTQFTYGVGQKTGTVFICQYLYQILTDFQNSFTAEIKRTFVATLSLKIPKILPHLSV